MVQQSFDFDLGAALRATRKARNQTQELLAHTAGLTHPTIRLLERGKGTLASFWKVLDVLELHVMGRNLPAGETVGRQIEKLRKRRDISQRKLAVLVGCSPVTIIWLERDRGRLETLEKVFQVLGAGVYLAPPNHHPAFFTHSGNSSVHHGWATPKSLLEKLYSVVGTFDLDPCSSTIGPSALVKARVHFSPTDDGLHLPWFGNVFVNPPYGRFLVQWIAKAHTEVCTHRADMVIALVPARTDTRWWHRYVAGYADVLLLRGRLRFGDGTQSAPFPSALVIWGAQDSTNKALREVFPSAWYVPSSFPKILSNFEP